MNRHYPKWELSLGADEELSITLYHILPIRYSGKPPLSDMAGLEVDNFEAVNDPFSAHTCLFTAAGLSEHEKKARLTDHGTGYLRAGIYHPVKVRVVSTDVFCWGESPSESPAGYNAYDHRCYFAVVPFVFGQGGSTEDVASTRLLS